MKPEPPSPRLSSLRPSPWWRLLLLILPLVGAVLGVMVGSSYSFSAGNLYRSSVLMEIRPPDSHFSRVGEAVLDSEREAMTDRYLNNQHEILRSDLNLLRVAERLDLPSRWELANDAQAEVLAILHRAIDVERVNESDLFRITVRHRNPLDARDIAHAVPIAYKERREELQLTRAKTNLEALDYKVRTMEDLASQTRNLFQTIVKAVEVPYLQDPSGSREVNSAEQEILVDAKKELATLKLRQALAETELNALQELEDEDLFFFLASESPSSTFAEDTTQYLQTKGEVGSQREQFGDEHPTVRSLEENLNSLREKLGGHAEAKIGERAVSFKILKAQTARAIGHVQSLTKEVVDRALQLQEYHNARNEYEMAAQLLNDTQEEATRERMALRTPLHSIVIHSEPLLATAPDRSGLKRTTRSGAISGAALGLFTALLILTCKRPTVAQPQSSAPDPSD